MKRKGKKRFGWLLLLAMVFGTAGMAGCGQAAEGSEEMVGEEIGKNEEQEENSLPEETAEGEKVMGRYLEQADDSLAEELSVESSVVRMEDGTLAILSGRSGKWVSEDGGNTWEREEMEWYEEWKAAGTWIMNMAAAKDGHIAVIYETAEEGGADAGTEGNAGNGADAGTEGNAGNGADAGTEGNSGNEIGTGTDGWGSVEDDGMELHMEDFSLHPKYGVIDPDGIFTELEIPYKDSDYIDKFLFSGDGRLFGSALDGKVYEIDKKTGASKEIIELSHQAVYMTEMNGRLMLVSSDGVTIVDTASGKAVEDKVLDDFLREQLGPDIDSGLPGVQPLLLLPGEEGILYLVFDKGIYRHVIGGNVVEQVVDGSLTSLGNPSYGLSDGLLLENDVFLLVFASGEIMHYTYDPDMPAVPEIRLRAYSLREDAQIKRIISGYQAEHPEVYIQYETGMDENLAVTREDALKKLNTEIAAGKGPDIFILDDMPIDSYKEKGVLMDLSPYLEDKTEDKYFTNIIHAFWTPEGTYAVPGKFQMALIVGKEDEIEEMTGLEAMAGMMEAYREEKAEGLLLGARDAEEMLSILLPVCAPAWKDGEGKIDKAALERFYMLAKRMWDAESAGVDEEQKENYERWIEVMRESGISEDEMREYQFSIGGKMTEYLTGRQRFVAGAISDSLDFDMMVSCFKIKGKTDSGFCSYNGQANKVFLPDGLVGIGASCAYPEIAAGLLEDILNDDGWNGMPVNKEKCRERFLVNVTEDGGSYGTMGVESEDSENYLALDIYPASEEEIAYLMELASAACTPYVRDSVLENAVYLAGVKVLCGEMDAPAAAEEVVRKTAIYMSE